MKKTLLIIVLFNTLLVFQDITVKGNETMNISQTKNKTNNVELVYDYFKYFNNHNWKKLAKMYINIAEFKDPSIGPGIVKQTHEQIIQKYRELNNIFGDIHDEIVAIYPSGANHVIVEFVSSGTAPDGSKFDLPICTIFTFKNGLIAQDFSYFDNFEE